MAEGILTGRGVKPEEVKQTPTTTSTITTSSSYNIHGCASEKYIDSLQRKRD